MASSLREIKDRIASVNSTLKITSAMKMVASAKLHRAQRAIENMLPYEQKLNQILMNFLASGVEIESPLTEAREQVKRVAIVAISSNTTLCGAFNANVARRLGSVIERHNRDGLTSENIEVFPIGRQITRAIRRAEWSYNDGSALGLDFEEMAERPTYNDATTLAVHLTRLFLKGEVDRVELVYNHFKSTGVQEMMHDIYLPLDPKAGREEGVEMDFTDYIIEPDAEQITLQLLPKVLNQKIYTVMLDSNAAEHAARMVAMQTATDNGDELLEELTIQFNKSRQESITNELLDIMGALSNE